MIYRYLSLFPPLISTYHDLSISLIISITHTHIPRFIDISHHFHHSHRSIMILTIILSFSVVFAKQVEPVLSDLVKMDLEQITDCVHIRAFDRQRSFPRLELPSEMDDDETPLSMVRSVLTSGDVATANIVLTHSRIVWLQMTSRLAIVKQSLSQLKIAWPDTISPADRASLTRLVREQPPRSCFVPAARCTANDLASTAEPLDYTRDPSSARSRGGSILGT